MLLDTNLLVLLTIGSHERALIPRHKRTNQFTVEDYDLLVAILDDFPRHVTTPNILTEASNLVDQIDGKVAQLLQGQLERIVGVLDEQYIPSSEAARVDEFRRLGLSDSAILLLAGGDLLVLTVDLHLYLALEKRKLAVRNFNHLRELSWGA